MRNFLNEYGATSTTVNEITISAAVSEINFTDTTPGDDDWRIYVDGDDFIFEREGIEEFRFDTSDNRLEINGAISCTASADIAGALSVGSLDVSAGSSLGSLTVSGNVNIGLQCSAGSLYTSGNADIDGNLKIKGALYTSANVYIQGGDVQYTRSNAGADIKIQVYNSSSSTASNAQIEVVTESNGDPEFRCYNKSAYWVQGIPNNNGNAYCINSGAGLGTASAALVITTSDDITIPNGDFTVEGGQIISNGNRAMKHYYNTASTVYLHIENTNSTAGASAYSELLIETNSTAGNPLVNFRTNAAGAVNWSAGIDTNQGNAFCINNTTDVVTSGAALVIDTSDNVKISNGTLDVAGTCNVGDLDVSAAAAIGSLDVSGNSALGSLQVSGNASANTLDIAGAAALGSCDVSAEANVGSLVVSGNANIGGQCSAGSLVVSAGATIGGDLTVSRSASGSSVAITIENSNTTSSSRAQLAIITNAAGGYADPHIRMVPATSSEAWTILSDFSAALSNSFVIAQNNGVAVSSSHYGLQISQAKDVYVPNGTFDVAGACNVGSLDVSANSALGSLQVSGNASANTLDVAGAAAVGSLDVSGNCDVNGKVAANTFGVQSVFASANAVPSSANFTSAFGFAQATAGAGFYGIYSDSATAHYLVMCNGTDWFSAALTKQT